MFEKVNDAEENFVQFYGQSKNCSPFFILYTQDQITDMRFHLANSNNQIFGIDRTFNLGPLFLTALSYKDIRLQRSTSAEHPVKLGALMLHKQARDLDYILFLSHIKGQLSANDDVEIEVAHSPEINIGSDQERALLKAIKSVFPGVKNVLCYLYLKENIIRFMRVN